ncbi:MAG: pyruvate dehydrogenase E2 component (dihydrolipoamide acetyltransferase) [bacterium]|jgi:pyruvate dehydrogenase E2 component (dihydrolipoamide acetyltransferase)
MAKEVKLPDLGDGIAGGTIINIMVSVGDSIQIDDPILELETDKATVEVPSPSAGIVEKVTVKNGDPISIGDVIVVLSSAKKAKTERPAKPVKEAKVVAPKAEKKSTPVVSVQARPKVVQVKVPEMGDGIEEVSVIAVPVSVGDVVTKDTPMLEVETDKATVEIPVEIAGTVKSVSVKTGAKVKVGQLILEVETSIESAPTKAPVVSVQSNLATSTTHVELPEETPTPFPSSPAAVKINRTNKVVAAAPSVRRFAREIGVKIADVKGTGSRGRITLEDVKLHSKTVHMVRTESAGSLGVESLPLPDFTKIGKVERVKMSRIREITARNMTHAWNAIPHVTQFDKANITTLEDLRKNNKQFVEAQGGKLTITAILIKVLAMALKEFPSFNVSVDMNSLEIIQKHYYNIGVAMDTPNGLMVPVIRDVDQKNIGDIAKSLTEYSVKAKNRKLAPADFQGGCMAITNLGGIAGTGFTPIVNWPDVAILGVSKSEMQPLYVDGKFEPALMMPLSLSYDHRVIDGAIAARFLQYITQLLENPFRISLEG